MQMLLLLALRMSFFRQQSAYFAVTTTDRIEIEEKKKKEKCLPTARDPHSWYSAGVVREKRGARIECQVVIVQK